MTTRISAQAVSAALARAGFTRATKAPGGRGGVLSPTREGFKVWALGRAAVLVDHLPHDAETRDEQLAQLEAALDTAGYQVKPVRGGLEVTAAARGPRQLEPCGTIAAYNRHIRHEEPVDDACRDAKNGYYAEYRASQPAPIRSGARQRAAVAARYRALVRLSEMDAHAARFAELVAERVKPGQEPWRVYGPARTVLAHENPEDYRRLHAEERTARGLAS